MIHCNTSSNRFFLLIALLCGLFASAQQDSTEVKVSKSIRDMYLKDASSLVKKYEYNPTFNQYIYTEKIGNYDISVPMFLSVSQYEELVLKEKSAQYFREKSKAITSEATDEQTKAAQRDLLPEFYVNSTFFEDIFGGRNIDIIPQGSIGVDLGFRFNRNDNPNVSPEYRDSYTFDFDQRFNLGVQGKVGTRLNVNAMYDTQSTFDFQNIFKLEYTPNEDDIVRKIEVGNVNFPLSNSLITGAQSLFGVKTELQFGRTTVTGVFSEQRSQSKTLTAQGGGTLQEFEVRALDYDENRNYFLSQFFREQYDKALENYPFIRSKVQITRIEVWATNRSNRTGNIRNLVALQDLGEALPQNTRIAGKAPAGFFKGSVGNRPTNSANGFDPLGIDKTGVLNKQIRDVATIKAGFGSMQSLVNEGFDYAILENAQKLEEGRDYKVNTQLGYISLSQRLNNDEILAVAYQYTYEGNVYQVGEFANDGISATTSVYQAGHNEITNNCLVLKMLKSNRVVTGDPIWNLMMKNIYSINALRMSKEGFKLNIFYNDPSPVNYISPVDEATWNHELTRKVLLQLFNFDRLNPYNDPENGGDGFFDFVEGITIDPDYGKIIFTKVEPFGKFLFDKMGSANDYNNPTSWNANQKKYVYKSLYTEIKSKAQEDAERNKFVLKGKYKSTGARGISLGAFNVPKGAVRVRVGGRILQEGIDYTVNYQMGLVQILDPTIENSNMPVEVSVENSLIFGGQSRRYIGVNINHQVNEKISVGASLINMREKPYTQKASHGQEPVSNTIFGFGGTYSTELPFLTRLVNKIPTMQTDAPSNLSLHGEVAVLRPGAPKATNFEGKATAYIDDFEATQVSINLSGARSWSLASTPLEFGNSAGELYGSTPTDTDNLKNGFKRAKLAWYSPDPIFYSENRPSDVSVNEISKNSSRRIFIKELFPEQEIAQGELLVQNTFDLAYFPKMKGPYNNNPLKMTQVTGQDKWAGIMRGISTTNFEDNNIEYIQFWLLDPYTSGEFAPSMGELVFDIGNISEDILKDGRKQYENGLPGLSTQTPTTPTAWGQTPVAQSILYAFDANADNRRMQDLGLDGLNDQDEGKIYTQPDNPADPAGDNYEYFLSRGGDIPNRYLNYNGTQGNSQVNGNPATADPDVEDVNRDNTMNTVNSYYSYRVPIHSNISRNDSFINDIRETSVEVANGDVIKARWIQFKVPINYNNRKAYGGGADLRSVTHIRMYVTGFEENIVLRLGTLELLRGDWRHYTKSLKDDLSTSFANTQVEINSVSVIENDTRQPIPYRMPPGVEREQINQNNTIISQNEQALSLIVRELSPGDARGIYKNFDIDLRQYKRLKMFFHAEKYKNEPLFDGQVIAFIRLGSDLSENFYQVEIPLQVTPAGTHIAEQIWPQANMLDVLLENLTKIKAQGINTQNLSELTYYSAALTPTSGSAPLQVGQYRYAVKGNPSLASVKTILIGLKNPTGNQLSAEVWINELRLSELENKGGWAAVGGLDLNAADFMNMALLGRMSTSGFGSVEQKPNERSKEDLKEFNAMASINAGKLLPKKWNIQLPIGLNFAKSIATPEYDPQYEDLRLKDRLELAQNASQRKAIEEQAQDYTLRQGISFIGVKKGLSPGKKVRFYSVENFTLNYAYNQMHHHDYEIASQDEQEVRMGATYAYSFIPYSIEPFKEMKKFSASKYWKWLSQINLNPLPSNLRFATNIARNFSQQQFREVYSSDIDQSKQIGLPEFQQRNYLFDWQYGVNFNLTKSLRVGYDASNKNIVRNYYTFNNLGERTVDKDLNIWNDMWNTGSPTHFMSALNVNYELPIDKFPFLQFVKASYAYTANFDWSRGSDALTEIAGEQINTLQNASTHNLTTNLSFDRLYTELGYRRKSYNDKRTTADRLKELAMMIKRAGFNYSQTSGTVLPGYLPQVGFFGTSKPSMAFVFGSQDDDIRYEAAKRGWLTKFDDFNEQFVQSNTQALSYTLNLQPITDLQIDLSGNRQYTENLSESFEILNSDTYHTQITNRVGTFSISDNMLGTAFLQSNEYRSKAFENFKANRLIIARRLATEYGIDYTNPANVDADGYPKGFGKNNQGVMMPAFYAAYTGRNPESVSLKTFKNLPLPNWNVRYMGLAKLEPFKRYFRRFSISHGYRSTYSLNDFRQNLEYKSGEETDQAGNFRQKLLFTAINLTEQFSPLIRLDMELHNTISFLAEIRNDRTVSISLDNNYLTEVARKEYRLGLGYRIRDLRFVIKIDGRDNTLKSDLNLKADISLRNDFTVIRNMELNSNQVTSGQTSWVGRFKADYALSQHLTTAFYFDYNFSKYAVSTSFPMTTIRSGITLRYTF